MLLYRSGVDYMMQPLHRSSALRDTRRVQTTFRRRPVQLQELSFGFSTFILCCGVSLLMSGQKIAVWMLLGRYICTPFC